ncbi:hypothetical protein [Peterkaempfera sp. SMS 1(5)a]|uniref:hypothetical protein n=1 Tax=Peterkaempfera podocarpi TaxID=3232308 RepID=UPI00366FEF91
MSPCPERVASFCRQHLLFTAHLPTGLHHVVARTEQDDPDQAPVVWRPAATAWWLRR